MKLSLASWSLRSLTLDEAAGLSRVLGIGALDLGYFYKPGLDREALIADPDGTADRVLQLGVALPNLYHLFGGSLSDRNLADPRNRERNEADFRQVVRFAKRAGLASVFVLPGVVNPGQDRVSALTESAESLRRLVAISAPEGIQLTVEPHVHSYLESPTLVLDLLYRVPGLKLTLDYAHFACLGYRQEEIDVLASHAAHVHLRQARAGVLQCKLALGTLNFGAMLGTLRAAGYNGYLSIEYVHQDYMDGQHDDVLTETVDMRDCVREWLA
ncbi:sugar phosphate isomerase/epimerase family protein [Kaistia terrae]|uniref:Sugar phosphate isomerase/epimerase family protein n=1 Tax=Kaistia terrae TaxID=537017 RepID=A0ABW0PX33_9HYPH|nr:sugar phosphate isomerase/epimerase [Kaistia terrae]MCX5579271.1 sugar phosphate isomerase/epimerase [Kaistia terrae]